MSSGTRPPSSVDGNGMRVAAETLGALEQRDAMAPAEEIGGRQPGNPRTDDRDVLHAE